MVHSTVRYISCGKYSGNQVKDGRIVRAIMWKYFGFCSVLSSRFLFLETQIEPEDR